MTLSIKNLSLLVLMLISASSSQILRAKPDYGKNSPRFDLEEIIPKRFDIWQIDNSITQVAPPPDLQAVLAKTYDQTLSRTYSDQSGHRIMLSIAYSGDFSSKSIQYHRPENCYPSQGFQILSSGSGVLSTTLGNIPITRLSTKNNTRVEPLTYWVTVAGSRSKYGYAVRWLQIKSNLTGKIPDGLLVRFSSIDSDTINAYSLQDNFAQSMLSNMARPDAEKLTGYIAQ